MPISKHVGYLTLASTSCFSSGQLHEEPVKEGENEWKDGEDELVPFKRVAVQIRTTQEGLGKVIKDLEAYATQYPVSESATVLADAFEFTNNNREASFTAKLATLQVSPAISFPYPYPLPLSSLSTPFSCVRLTVLQSYPSLLYQLSDSLRKLVFPNIAELMDAHWKNVLLYLEYCFSLI